MRSLIADHQTRPRGDPDALSKIAPDVVTYFKNRATHRDIGDRLLAAWETGIQHSLGFADRLITKTSTH
jgi:hypothetical protein